MVKETYFEDSDGYWVKRMSLMRMIIRTYLDSSDGDWWKSLSMMRTVIKLTLRTQTGYWYKYEYDENGNETYYENSRGIKRGFSKNDVLELTVSEIEEKYGRKVKIVNKK